MFFLSAKFLNMRSVGKTINNVHCFFHGNTRKSSDTVTLIPGSGIGPELMNTLKDIFTFIQAPISFEVVELLPGGSNDDLNNALASIRKNRAAVKGNFTRLIDKPNEINFNIQIRKELDMFTNIVHCFSYKNVQARYKNLDVVVVRENTEGEYKLLEHSAVPGVVECLKIATEKNTNRIIRYAFLYAKKYNRKKVTTVHKANIMKLSDGLFLKTAKKIAKEYPEIKHNDLIVDNCCMQLVSDPYQFDVIVTGNLYGNIISNILAGLCGGPGLFSSQNYSETYGIFENGCRSIGNDIVGKNIANPTGILNSGIDLLRYFKHDKIADVIEKALRKSLEEDGFHTPDIGGTYTTSQVIDNIKANIEKLQK